MGVALGKVVAAIFVIEVPMACIWASIGSGVAAGLEAEDISVSNATEVYDAITGVAAGGSPLKHCLLLLGVLSILGVVHLVHKQVSKQLRIDQGTSALNHVEDGGP